MWKKILLVVALVALGASFGCATMNSVVKAKNNGKGTTKVYSIGFDQAWEIAKTVFRWEGTDAIEEHYDRGYMLTSSGMNLVSYGAVMGAWLEKDGAESTNVTVVTKRRLATNVATTLTEKTFHKRFGQAVGIVKSGQSLPMEKPQN